MPTQYYTTNQACKIVGISRTTFYNWLRQGYIPVPPHNHRGHRLISDELVRKMLDRKNRLVFPGEQEP